MRDILSGLAFTLLLLAGLLTLGALAGVGLAYIVAQVVQ